MITAPNDWDIKRCLLLALAILSSLLGLIGMGYLGFNIPLLREIAGFIFLTFIPGMFILRVFRIHNIGLIESLLYSVALSIAFIYFTGLFANFVLPLLGISKPISLLPITAVLTIFTFILGLLAYKRDKGFSPLSGNLSLSFKEIPLSFYLLLLLLPLLAILGTQLVNAYQNNVVLLFLLGLIVCIVGWISSREFSEKVYPLILTSIAVSLVFFTSLISSQLWAEDVHRQYFFQHLVLKNGFWESSLNDYYNSCLSLVILCPIYSLIMGIEDLWVFKIILPLILSIMPLTIFSVFRKQMKTKSAFLASFYFMTVPGGIIGTQCSPGREASAKIFIMLLVLLLVDRKLNNLQKSILAIIFSLSLVFTHYSSAYICIALLAVGWLILQLIKCDKLFYLLQRLFNKKPTNILSALIDFVDTSLVKKKLHWSLLNSTLLLLLFIFSMTWYMNIADASAFKAVINMGNTVYKHLIEFYDPAAKENIVLAGLGAGFTEVNNLSKIFRILQYSTELFISVGLFAMLLKPRQLQLEIEFFVLSLSAAIFLFFAAFLPGFSVHLGFRRIYNFTLLFLSPLFVLGAEVICKSIKKLWFTFNNKRSTLHLQNLALIIVIPYFLFTTGFISAISGRYCEAVGLSGVSMVLGPYKMDRYVFTEQENRAANWLWNGLPNNTVVYADLYGASLLWQQLYGKALGIPPSGDIPKDAYIFLRKWNLEHNEVVVTLDYAFGAYVNLINRPKLSKRLEYSEVIYNNGGSKILAPTDQKGKII